MSRLLVAIDEVTDLPLAAPVDVPTRIREVGEVPLPWQDRYGPSLESGQTQGGTALLKDQAHCPFRAFVHHRLQVSDFREPHPGLSPGIRGELVHRCLEAFWRQVKTQEQLLHLTVDQRREVISGIAHQVVANYFEGGVSLSGVVLQLEQQRLSVLLEEWLEQVEGQRAPFTVIATEQRRQVDIGPLQIRVVADRIDELAGGERMIVDYKTGIQVRIADLLTHPPLEPQLPSYVLSREEEDAVAGVLVGKVRRGDCRLVGIAANPEGVGVRGVVSVKEEIGDWQTLVATWQEQIVKLAEDFADGSAGVTPFSAESCRYCDLPSLCRIAAGEEEGDL